ncbi:MAG: hypothetical protein QOI74_780 [Micromonosporaceae bacterium]|nr:hypothetical protein [Micromonosporaceae bacterium]
MVSALLPVVTLLLTGYALRPGRAVGAVGRWRLAAVRSAVAVGAYAIVGVEILSALHAVTRGPIMGLWITGAVAAATVATLRHRRDGVALDVVALDGAVLGRAGSDGGIPRRGSGEEAGGDHWSGRVRAWPVAVRGAVLAGWRRASLAELALAAASAVLVAAELVVALVSPPNNYDSNYYHLPKVEHWAAQHSVALYPTPMRPQVVLAPGAEYLLLHLRLLTGDDRAYNLVQWSAALLCAVLASRIAAQLGAGRLGQWIAAVTVAAAPMVVLEATSTQNDLVVAAWVACAATLVVDEIGRRPTPAAVLGIGTAAGLTVVTKPTGWLALAPVLVFWGIAQLRRFGWPAMWRTALGCLGIVALVAILAGPYLYRVDAEFGSPLGPPEQADGLALQRHDPAAVLVNALRIGASTMAVPVPAINRAVADAVMDVARAVGVDPQDRRITVASATYPDPRWWPDEDHSPYPVQSALVLLSTCGLLVARRVPARVRGYALVVLGALLLYAAVLKWQTWGNRLVGAAVILGAPLVGWALPEIVTRLRAVPWQLAAPGQLAVPRLWAVPQQRIAAVAAAVLALVVAGGVADGYYAVLLGAPRPLVGADSVLLHDQWDLRFARVPAYRPYYEWGADQVRASGARRVGIVVRGDQWEYPWWLMLPGTRLVALESVLPHHPAPPSTSVEAILCAAPPEACQAFVPPGWRLEERGGWFGVALPGQTPG